MPGDTTYQALTRPCLHPPQANRKYLRNDDYSQITQRSLTQKHWHVLSAPRRGQVQRLPATLRDQPLYKKQASPHHPSHDISILSTRQTKQHTPYPQNPQFTHSSLPRTPRNTPPKHLALSLASLAPCKSNPQPDCRPLKHVLRFLPPPPSLPHAFRFNAFVSKLPTCSLTPQYAKTYMTIGGDARWLISIQFVRDAWSSGDGGVGVSCPATRMAGTT